MAVAAQLLRELVAQIRFRGPMTFGDYMRTCLTHPLHGYYMRNDVFGRAGDFITGPEISQTYGELVGVWAVAMWQQMGEPPAVRIVEAGPGRGTLMADMLRVISRHERLAAGASVELIEVSPWMRAKQRQTLCADQPPGGEGGEGGRGARTRHGGMPVSWHDSLRDLLAAGGAGEQPDGGDGGARGASAAAGPVPSIFVAHEFLDALPVHKFRRAPPARAGGPPGPWREVLVDVADDEEEEGGAAEPLLDSRGRLRAPAAAPLGSGRTAGRAGAHPLRFVLAPSATPALAVYSHLLPPTPATPPHGQDGDEARSAVPPEPSGAAGAEQAAPPPAEGVEVEICPLALGFAADVAAELARSRGAALLIDYGPAAGPVADSARAIVKHSFVHLLEQPGDADLSALVDFGALQQAVGAVPGVALGAVCSQRELLGALGLEARVNALLANAKPHDARAIVAAAQRLVAMPGMGDEYKALAFCDARTGTPVGFRPLGPAAL